MIVVAVERDGAGRVIGLTVNGHAGHAQYGEDIVCAGVSALAQTAVIGLRQVAGVEHQARSEDGFLECRLLAGASGAALDRAQAILETIVLGLKDIQQTYPKYVRVQDQGQAGAGSQRRASK